MMLRSTHNRRLSRTQVLLVLAMLILPCVLLLVIAASDGFNGTGVPASSGASLESFFRDMSARQSEQFAILTNCIASMHRQISELIDVNRTTEWMHARQARSVDIDQTLAPLCASMDAMQSASVSSVEAKSVVSDWPLPGSASSGSNRRASQSHIPSESVGISQLLGKRQKKLSFSPAQKNVINKTKSSFAVLFLLGSLVVRTRTLFRSFVPFPSLMLIQIHTRPSARSAVIMLASSSFQPIRGEEFCCSTENLFCSAQVG